MTDPITQAVARLSKSTAHKFGLYEELCRVVRREQFDARETRGSGP